MEQLLIHAERATFTYFAQTSKYGELRICHAHLIFIGSGVPSLACGKARRRHCLLGVALSNWFQLCVCQPE